MIEILAGFAVLFNDLIALVAMVAGAALLFAPKQARRVLETAVILWLVGVIAQIGLALSDKQVERIGVLQLSPGVVAVMLTFGGGFFLATLVRVLTERRKTRRRNYRRDRYSPRRR